MLGITGGDGSWGTGPASKSLKGSGLLSSPSLACVWRCTCPVMGIRCECRGPAGAVTPGRLPATEMVMVGGQRLGRLGGGQPGDSILNRVDRKGPSRRARGASGLASTSSVPGPRHVDPLDSQEVGWVSPERNRGPGGHVARAVPGAGAACGLRPVLFPSGRDP